MLDLIVVGGGPAGLLTATRCAEAGLNVLVLEEHPELGAPNLADAIWFYGSGEADIAAQVRAPKHGVMPAWQARLGETTVKQLSVYVHSLGGGE